jgi:hypothetical protein
MWFLWMLMAMTAALVALRRFTPKAIALLVRASSVAAASPRRYFWGLAAVAALAYVPLALAFTPWEWSKHGPFSCQLSRPLLYFVYYAAGFGVGAHGLERGLLSPRGALARNWRRWLLLAIGSFVVWMGLTGLTMSYPTAAPWLPQVSADLSFVAAGASGVFFLMAACLRLHAFRSRPLDRLSDEAFGIYLIHYAPLVWLQFGLMNVPLFALAKAGLAFGGALLLTFTTSAALRSALGRWRDRLRGAGGAGARNAVANGG